MRSFVESGAPTSEYVVTPREQLSSCGVLVLIHWEEIVQSDRYFHAELGYFCPTPRLRRELRVACCAGLFGVAVGAASVIALSRTDRAANPPSPVPPAATQPGARNTLPRQLANKERDDLQKPSATQATEGEAVQGTPTRHYEFTMQSNVEILLGSNVFRSCPWPSHAHAAPA